MWFLQKSMGFLPKIMGFLGNFRKTPWCGTKVTKTGKIGREEPSPSYKEGERCERRGNGTNV